MRHYLVIGKDDDKLYAGVSTENCVLTYMHHEHYDGSGYPQGLSGEKIPIEAQIIQAADAFDAMVSKRAYRDALSIETVMNIFRDERGKQFNPEVTDAILSLFTK